MKAAIFVSALWLAACGKVSVGDGDGDGDADADAAVDATPPMVSIGDLRAMTDGEVDVLVEGIVTYVRGNGFHLQIERTGPAIAVFIGADPVPVAVGNQVVLHVTNLSSFMDNKQIDEMTVVDNDEETADVIAELAQDLMVEGLVPGEDLEAELVVVPEASYEMFVEAGTYIIGYDSNGVALQARAFSLDRSATARPEVPR